MSSIVYTSVSLVIWTYVSIGVYTPVFPCVTKPGYPCIPTPISIITCDPSDHHSHIIEYSHVTNSVSQVSKVETN